MRIKAILLFAILASGIYTTSAFAQSPPKPQIVVTGIAQVTQVIVANSPNNMFSIDVTNTGNAAGTKSITMVMYQNYGSDNESTHACTTISGLYEASVTLSPGEHTAITWMCTVYNPGTYQVKSLGKTLDFQVSADQGKLYVSKVTVDPIKPKLGDNAVFTVTVKNFNAIQGSKNISYKLTFYSTPPFDASFGTKSITLGPEGSTTFTVDAVFSSGDPWRFYADDYVYDPIVEEAKMQLKKDVEEEKKIEQEEETEQEEEETDDTDEIEEEEEQISGSKLVVTNVIITPRKNLKPNDIVTIIVVVKNVGDVEDTKSVVPVINAPTAGKSAMVDAKSVTVKPGKEKQVSWQIPILVSGIYDVFVEGSSSTFQVKSTAQDTKKPTDTSDKKKFDIDDAADFDNGKKITDTGNKIRIEPIEDEKLTDDKLKILKEFIEKYNKKSTDSSDKKKFDIDDAADFDTDKNLNDDLDKSDKSSIIKTILIDVDRISTVSDIQIANDLESIRDKILSVDFGTVGSITGTTKSESNSISQKFDSANDKLRIAIEKGEPLAGLKQQLENAKENDDKLYEKYLSDFDRWKKIWNENRQGNPSEGDKVRELEAAEDQATSQEQWEESSRNTSKLEKEVKDLESETNAQYDDAMKDLESAHDELNKIMEGEPNYEDKNQKPFVTDDLKKETYQEATRTMEDIMRVTEEYEKNRDALQKQDELKQIIHDAPVQVTSSTIFNKIMNSDFASGTFYPGDIEGLIAVDRRADFQNAVWEELSDSGTLEANKEETIQKLEQKSESNTQQIHTQTPLVDKLQDSSYFGTIPSSDNANDVSTILFSGYDVNFGNNVISADIPIKLIFDDENTAKYSVLGGNLAIVDPTTKQIDDVLSVAFGKGRIDHQNNKMTFLINVVDSSGQHQTITLSSAEKSSSLKVSGQSEIDLAFLEIRRSLLIESMNDNQLEEAILKAQMKKFARSFVGSEYIPSVDEWKKLLEQKKLAEKKKNEALEKYNNAPEGAKVRALVDLVDAEREYENAATNEKDARDIIDREAKSGRIDKTARTGGY
ncbi:MAG: hypothetical protein ACT4NT_07225 [Nitrososphaerota archaeon]